MHKAVNHKDLLVRHLGMVPYREALEFQLRTHAAVVAGTVPHTLLLVEHPPVFTLGKRGGREFFRAPESEVVERGAEIVQTDRGGLVTFHGPGQLVGYPILSLERLRLSLASYIELLLESLTRTLHDCGIDAAASMDTPGIFVQGRKIGAVGVRLRDHVTYHGFALNVDTDLAWFDLIVGCGLEGVAATSVSKETGRRLALGKLGQLASRHLAARLGLTATFPGLRS